MKQTLLLNEKHLKHAQQIAKVGSWEHLIEEDKLYCSDYFFEIFGFDRTDHVSMEKPFQFVHPADYDKSLRKIKQAYKGKNLINEFRIYHGKTNELKHIQVQAETIWKDSKPYKLIGVVKDNTAKKKLENDLIKSNEDYRYIFNNLSAGIWMRESIRGKLTFASRGVGEILQLPLEKVYEEPDIWREMVPNEYRVIIEEEFKKLVKGESISIIYPISIENETTKWVLEQTIPRLDENGNVINLFGMVTDITSEVKKQEKLDYLALHDSLTSLPNQQSINNKINELIATSTSFALFYLDIDRFNIINNSLGYQIGDETLKTIASKLTLLIEEQGLVGRVGSNDFIILVESYRSRDSIKIFAEKMIKEIEEPIVVKDYELHVTTSIGISFYPEEGNNKLSLLENAHAALLQAKKQGKNNYQLYSSKNDISSYKKYILDKI
ncbi:diguanylate cyclase domain-containing protein [Virgibacillus halodenitrificans]|uniref:diguanylate cyclase domain-containing protein n=1 Tax=Virgibacillus halodenitrificans TaxID=1482 RepID=UPI002DB8D43B|nr:diguanylate cyclase [Virgibacillus halodenitrificans]MEC2159734.1 diguanylate cyclase [Virgibacillus halodenitrificans]